MLQKKLESMGASIYFKLIPKSFVASTDLVRIFVEEKQMELHKFMNWDKGGY